MDIKEFGLDNITEIYNKFNSIIDNNLFNIDDNINNKILIFRMNNIFTYINNISNELNNISNDINNLDNKEYIEKELSEMIKLENIIDNFCKIYITNLHH